jgi:peptidoglycan/xylan/chitin deacetylase (PgdA/CDA1 family)
MCNFLTLDFETWADSSRFLLDSREAERMSCHLGGFDPQLERGVRAFLDALWRYRKQATFFVQASTIAAHKDLVVEVHNSGHEIASHSLSHPLFDNLPRLRMREELRCSRQRLEDLIGAPVIGFRAPNLSLGRLRQIFFEELLESGYRYDSSMTERSVRALFRKEDCGPFEIPGASPLIEYPITTATIWGKSLNLGGTQLAFISSDRIRSIARIANSRKVPLVLYLHPYELDAARLRWPHATPSLRAKIATGVRGLLKRGRLELVDQIISDLALTTIAQDLLQNGEQRYTSRPGLPIPG